MTTNGSPGAIGATGSNQTSVVALDDIKDAGAQMRVDMRPEIVAEYADEMLAGTIFPPVVLYQDGEVYWLADGYHRVDAARKIHRETITASIHEGTSRDAILHGIGSNAVHGLRRTQADKRRAVERLLTDPEWAKWSNRKVADAARVDHKTVGKIRRELTGEIPTPNRAGGEIPRRNGKPHGTSSLFDDVVRGIPDAILVAEYHRRGLTAGVGDD